MASENARRRGSQNPRFSSVLLAGCAGDPRRVKMACAAAPPGRLALHGEGELPRRTVSVAGNSPTPAAARQGIFPLDLENTKPGQRGRAPVDLTGPYTAVLDEYLAALGCAPLAAQTRRTYASKVRQYLAWLADAEPGSDPFASPEARDWTVRDYRTHLQAALKRKPATVNNALAAVDDLYTRRGLGPARAKRAEIPDAAPRALGQRAQIRYLRAVQACSSPRDRALALVPFYAGTRISETVALDLDDARLSARKGVLRILGKGERVREVPIHEKLRTALHDWLQERNDWPAAAGELLKT